MSDDYYLLIAVVTDNLSHIYPDISPNEHNLWQKLKDVWNVLNWG